MRQRQARRSNRNCPPRLNTLTSARATFAPAAARPHPARRPSTHRNRSLPMTLGTDIAACRGRQRRLLDRMAELKLDLAIVTQIEHIQWLAGPRFDWKLQPLAALRADGQLTLVAPSDWSEPA